MCHPVFSTKEFVQEFIFYSGVQEWHIQKFRSCRSSGVAEWTFGFLALGAQLPQVPPATPELRQLLNSFL
jgi:hypothetical protein